MRPPPTGTANNFVRLNLSATWGIPKPGTSSERTFGELRGFSFGIGEELGSGIDGEARENAIACLTVRGLGLASWMSQKPD